MNDKLAELFAAMFERMTPADVKRIVVMDAIAWNVSLNGSSLQINDARKDFMRTVYNAFDNMTEHDKAVLASKLKQE